MDCFRQTIKLLVKLVPSDKKSKVPELSGKETTHIISSPILKEQTAHLEYNKSQ